MKTKLFLFAALLITTITFSQTSKKGYDYYKAKSDVSNSQKRNSATLGQDRAKDVNLSKADAKRAGRNPQTGATDKDVKVDKFNVKQDFGQTKAKHTRQRPFDEKLEVGATKARHNWVPSRSRAGISNPSKTE